MQMRIKTVYGKHCSKARSPAQVTGSKSHQVHDGKCGHARLGHICANEALPAQGTLLVLIGLDCLLSPGFQLYRSQEVVCDFMLTSQHCASRFNMSTIAADRIFDELFSFEEEKLGFFLHYFLSVLQLEQAFSSMSFSLNSAKNGNTLCKSIGNRTFVKRIQKISPRRMLGILRNGIQKFCQFEQFAYQELLFLFFYIL